MERPSPYRPLRAVALLFALALVGCARDEPRPPNVLFVVVDTLRSDHLSSYGYPWRTSPNIDALAERGALFTNCTAGSSWTLPSMMSMFVGRPSFHTIWRLPDDLPVLPELFAEGGYRTGGFVANSILAEDAGFARGFETYEVREKKQRQWTADEVNRRALPFLDAPPDDERPFFAWVHYLDPHAPYDPPVRNRRFARTPDEVFDEPTRALIEGVLEERFDGTPATRRAHLRALATDVDLYDGEVATVDVAIGELVAALDARGLRDDTLVVILSDHGESLYERVQHPDKRALLAEHKAGRDERLGPRDELHQEHGYWITEELIRTPFVLAGPGVTPGRRSDALVSNLDAVETLLSMCGLEPLGNEGRDLARELRAPLDVDVPDASAVTSACSEWRTIKTPDGVKLSVPGDEQAARWGHTAERYDLTTDPGERDPRAPTAADAARLQRLEAARAADVFALIPDEMDDATRDRLRELGYLR